MSEPEEIRYACIGCGAMNRVGAEVCSGCGHRFGGPDFVSPPVSDSPVPARPDSRPRNLYEPPRARVGRAPTFRIGPAMALIAVIAVCLGAFVASPWLGVLATIGAVPATIRALGMAGRRDADGRPMDPGEQVATFVVTAAASYLVMISSIIAFGVTCTTIGIAVGAGDFPIGFLFAIGLGLVAALFAGVMLARSMLRAGRSREQFRRDRDLIRWR